MIEAPRLFPFVDMPCMDELWGKAVQWASETVNQTATSVNEGMLSPHEKDYRRPALLTLLPFMKPGFCPQSRQSKFDLKAD